MPHKLLPQIPKILIISRLFIGLYILGIPCGFWSGTAEQMVLLLFIGLITDIFDGIIARKLQVSTPGLRRWDSTVDQFFFLSVVGACFLLCPEFFVIHQYSLGLLFGSEVLIYLVCYIKFRKEVATHSIGAKIWTLTLFGTLVEIILRCDATTLFPICFWLGLITRGEILGIIVILKTWTTDVPTLYHAIQARKGRTIERHPLFNG